MLDLDAYLARIGLRERASLARMHRAHLSAIPFENLDPQRGVAASLAPEDLERKLVAEGRGGYCFEQNLLLAGALEELGAKIDLFLARVRRGARRATRPRSHLVLRVELDGAAWHADVGFGFGGPLEPLALAPGVAQEQSGWRFRLIEDGAELVLQAREASVWVDLYGFVPEPVPFVEIEMSNWWACTHPRSPFVRGLLVGRHDSAGTRISLSDFDGLALTEQTPAGRTTTPVARRDVPELLARRFGLEGFALARDGRLLASSDLQRSPQRAGGLAS